MKQRCEVKTEETEGKNARNLSSQRTVIYNELHIDMATGGKKRLSQRRTDVHGTI